MRKCREPSSGHQGGERRLLDVASRRVLAQRIDFEDRGVEADRRKGDDLKRRVEDHEPQQQEPGREPALGEVEPGAERRTDPSVFRLEPGGTFMAGTFMGDRLSLSPLAGRGPG